MMKRICMLCFLVSAFFFELPALAATFAQPTAPKSPKVQAPSPFRLNVQALKQATQNMKGQVRIRLMRELIRYAPQRNTTKNTFQKLLQHRNWRVRRQAVLGLQLLPQPIEHILQQLRRATKDKRAEVRHSAVLSMSRFGAQVIPELQTFLKQRDPKMNYVAAKALGRLGRAAKPTLPTLVQQLKHPKWWVRRITIEALGNLQTQGIGALPSLIQHLNDKDWGVRAAAAKAIGQIKHRPAWVLRALYRKTFDPNPYVRKACLRTLAALGASRPLVLKRAKQAMLDETVLVRLAAAYTLRKLTIQQTNSSPSQLLLSALKGEADWIQQSAIGPAGTKMEAAYTIRDLGAASKNEVLALTQLLRDPSNAVRYAASQALIRLAPQSRTATIALSRALLDRDAEVRSVVQRSLYQRSAHAEK